MDLLAVITEAFRIAYYTLVYAASYHLVLPGALAVSVLGQFLFPPPAWKKKLGSEKSVTRAGIAAAWGMLSSPRMTNLTGNTKWFLHTHGRPGLLVLYLVCASNLTVYYWALLGPLLGKEFLLVNATAAVILLLVALPLTRLLFPSKGLLAREPKPFSPADTLNNEKYGLLSILAREMKEMIPWVAAGAMGGGLIGAWGLSGWWWDLSAMGGSGTWASQLVNALVGMGLAVGTFSLPVANLFIATYLWKTGIALSGFVAYLSGASLSIWLWPVYFRHLGRKKALLLLLVLACGVLAASLGVAALFKFTGLDIHYKLSSHQLL